MAIFVREALMTWCEANRGDDVFGLACNARLEARIAKALDEARLLATAAGKPGRIFRDFLRPMKDFWLRRR